MLWSANLRFVVPHAAALGTVVDEVGVPTIATASRTPLAVVPHLNKPHILQNLHKKDSDELRTSSFFKRRSIIAM